MFICKSESRYFKNGHGSYWLVTTPQSSALSLVISCQEEEKPPSTSHSNLELTGVSEG